jgi:hypothetical protein
MRTVILGATALTLSACGADPVSACEDYINAANTCYTEALGTLATAAGELDAESVCSVNDGLKGSAAKEATDLYNCYTEAYAAADCSTTDGWSSVGTSILTDCV